jgi:hypothetical protein
MINIISPLSSPSPATPMQTPNTCWDDEEIDLTREQDYDSDNPFASTISTAGLAISSGDDYDIKDDYSDEDSNSSLELNSIQHVYVDKYAARRTYELDLIKKYDALSINNRRLCWFLCSTHWLAQWAAFVTAETEEERRAAEPPTEVSNLRLYQSSQCLEFRPELEKIRDYRGVSPIVWNIYVNIYGVDSSGAICRCEIDHKSASLTSAEVAESLRGCELKARVEVMRMKTNLGEESKGGYRKAWRPERVDEKVMGFFPRWTAEWFLERLFFCCRERPKTKYGRLVNDDDEDEDEGDDSVDEKPLFVPMDIDR